jgi:hypothetical protein
LLSTVNLGITGHQGLTPPTEQKVREALGVEISRRGQVCGISSLAEGADQLFAEEVLADGGSLVAVIPTADYEQSFSEPAALKRYRDLRGRASEVVELACPELGEDAYWAAGRRVVELADEMIAVWDGLGSRGLGGTADIVGFARERGIAVTVIWPPGSTRR